MLFLKETEDWNKFSQFCDSINLKLSTLDILSLKDKIFKRNLVNYKWNEKEDKILETIVL